MKKILFLLMVVVVSWCTLKKVSVKNPTACFGETCFAVELADTPEERREGLMHRESLAEDAGMLFVFDQLKPRINFRMKNTLIPLDMLRLDTDGQVVFLQQNVQPCLADPCPIYGPKDADVLTKYILEINAWKAAKENIGTWTKAILTY